MNDRSKNFPHELEVRMAKFGEAVIEFVKKLANNAINDRLIRQVVGSGTSVGMNYMEANGAESARDFVHKLSIARKEARETKFTIQMLAKANPEHIDEARIIWKEGDELTRILSKSINTTKSNQKV